MDVSIFLPKYFIGQVDYILICQALLLSITTGQCIYIYKKTKCVDYLEKMTINGVPAICLCQMQNIHFFLF